ncbi:uncharacterized protein LOC144602189 [Rhinoraja longicauda]
MPGRGDLWPGLLVVLALLGAAETGDLVVSMNSRIVEVLVNKDVLLECRVSGYKTSEINLQNVGVIWYLKRLGASTREEVYTFRRGKHTPYRKGAAIFDDELKKGIASLFLPLVQFNEEGDYTCVVFISPDQGIGKSSMAVSAKPRMSLSATAIIIENGTEKSVKCDSTAFYPLAIQISWLKKSKSGEQKVLDHICTGSPVRNADGTYNVSSRMRLRPTLQDDGNTYVCLVRHRSLGQGTELTIHLTVREPEIVVPGGIITGCVIASILLCSLIMGVGFLMYLKKFRKVSPKVSEIAKPPHIIHLEETVLTCQISGYKPANISLCCFLQRVGGNQSEIFQWSSAPGQPQASEAIDQQRLLYNCNSAKESFHIEMTAATHDGRSNAICKVIFIPDINKDDGTVLSLHVSHSTLGKPITKSIQLKVEGIAPKMTNILAPPHIIHEEMIALSCPIDGFKPRPLVITWYQKPNKDMGLKEIVRSLFGSKDVIAGGETDLPKYSHSLNELTNEDNTYNVTSFLIFTPTILEDHDAVYFCEVEHPATTSKTQHQVKLDVKAIPKCEDIKLEPEIPIAEEFVVSTCRIYSFFPKNIKVSWKMDNKLMQETKAETGPTLGADGRYSFTDQFNFIPAREDLGKILTCKLQHESIIGTKGTGRKLDKLISSPLMDDMKIQPQYPKPGDLTTISCGARGFYPRDIMFKWFKNEKRIDDKEVTSTDPEIDGNTGLFYSESRWKYIILPDDHQIDLKVEALHSPTSHRPAKIFHSLLLGGIPKLSDIILEPETPFYGQPLVLKCNVTNFAQNRISINWLMDDKPIVKGVRNTDPKEDQDGWYQLCSSLELIPTALHYNKKLVFEVKNGVTPEVISKHLYLPLPGNFPTVSEIKHKPPSPEESTVASFMVSLIDYVPQEIEVKWFKGEQPYAGPVHNGQPQIAPSGLFSSTTEIEFIPEPSDQDLEIRCEIFHLETKKRIEQKCRLTF